MQLQINVNTENIPAAKLEILFTQLLPFCFSAKGCCW